MYSDNLKRTYDTWSATYDNNPNPLIPVEEMAVRSLLRTIEAHDVLDVATGTGRHALYLASQGKNVTAVDANESMLREARRKAEEQNLAIRFELAGISNLPYESETFDLVICALALAHLEEIDQLCKELVRVLRPSRTLIISDLHPYHQAILGPDHYEELVSGHNLFFPNHHGKVDDYLAAVADAGVNIVAALDVPYLLLEDRKDAFIAIPGALVLWAKKPRGAGSV